MQLDDDELGIDVSDMMMMVMLLVMVSLASTTSALTTQAAQLTSLQEES